MLGLDNDQKIKKVKNLKFSIVEEIFAPRKGILELKKKSASSASNQTSLVSDPKVSLMDSEIEIEYEDDEGSGCCKKKKNMKANVDQSPLNASLI